MDKNKEYHFLKPLKYRVLWQSLIIGAAGGILVSLYRLLLSWAENFSGKLYASVFGDPWKIILDRIFFVTQKRKRRLKIHICMICKIL